MAPQNNQGVTLLVNWQEHVEDEMKKELAHNAPEDDEEFGTGRCAGYQRFLWDLMEKPYTSLAAKVGLSCEEGGIRTGLG